MRRCRVTFVSPPETNSKKSQCFVKTTEYNERTLQKEDVTSKNVHLLQYTYYGTLNRNDVNGETFEGSSKIEVYSQFCNKCNYDGTPISFKHYVQPNGVSKVLISKLPIQRYHEYCSSDSPCVFCCLIIIISFISSISVISNNIYNNTAQFLIKQLICLISVLQSLPKNNINNQILTTSCQNKCEEVRVKYPLSKWITTSPKKYPSKLF